MLKSYKLILLWILITIPSYAFASSTVGSISSNNKYGWSENIGWINFAPPNGNIQVTDTNLTGYAWSENHGWITLNSTNHSVLNDGEGNLSGNAWGEGIGYIDFSGVKIDSNGFFLVTLQIQSQDKSASTVVTQIPVHLPTLK